MQSKVLEQEDVMSWKKEATDLQQFLFEILGDRKYDYIPLDDTTTLRTKLNFALYGLPSYEYRDEQWRHVYPSGGDAKVTALETKIINTSIDIVSEGFFFAPIYICIKLHDKKYTEVVFRISNDDREHKVRYIDTTGEVYEDWDTFLANIWYPKCILLYPKNGRYNGTVNKQVLVEVALSPACSFQNRLGRKLVSVGKGKLFCPVNCGFKLIGLKTPVEIIASYKGFIPYQHRLDLLEEGKERYSAFQLLSQLLSIPQNSESKLTNKSLRLMNALQSIQASAENQGKEVTEICHSLAALILFFTHGSVSVDVVKSVMFNHDKLSPNIRQEYVPIDGILPMAIVRDDTALLAFLCKNKKVDD